MINLAVDICYTWKKRGTPLLRNIFNRFRSENKKHRFLGKPTTLLSTTMFFKGRPGHVICPIGRWPTGHQLGRIAPRIVKNNGSLELPRTANCHKNHHIMLFDVVFSMFFSWGSCSPVADPSPRTRGRRCSHSCLRRRAQLCQLNLQSHPSYGPKRNRSKESNPKKDRKERSQ